MILSVLTLRIVEIDVEFQVQLIFRSGVVMGTPIFAQVLFC